MNNIIFIGDIHGNIDYIKWILKINKITDTYLVQVGDFGAGVIKAYNKFNEFLSETNNILYVIRGNHDDPLEFEKTHNIESNIIFVKDYDIITLLDFNILFIGGAISIDRIYRIKEGYPFWFSEGVKQDTKYLDFLKTIEKIDMCVTHTSPINVFPYTFFTDDHNLAKDVRDERIYLEEIYDIIKHKGLKKWYYGHFHNKGVEYIDNVEFNLIDKNDILSLY